MLQRDKPQQSQAELAGGALYLPAKLPIEANYTFQAIQIGWRQIGRVC